MITFHRAYIDDVIVYKGPVWSNHKQYYIRTSASLTGLGYHLDECWLVTLVLVVNMQMSDCHLHKCQTSLGWVHKLVTHPSNIPDCLPWRYNYLQSGGWLWGWILDHSNHSSLSLSFDGQHREPSCLSVCSTCLMFTRWLAFSVIWWHGLSLIRFNSAGFRFEHSTIMITNLKKSTSQIHESTKRL